MKTSPSMQRVITRISQQHGLDLEASEAHLRLEMPNFDRLVVEKIGRRLLSVAHYFEQNGDLIAEPDVVFFTGNREWIPIQITQSLAGTRNYAHLSEDGTSVERINIEGQQDLAKFCEMWASNILEQGWIQDGQRA